MGVHFQQPFFQFGREHGSSDTRGDVGHPLDVRGVLDFMLTAGDVIVASALHVGDGVFADLGFFGK